MLETTTGIVPPYDKTPITIAMVDLHLLPAKKKTPLHVYDLWFSTQKRNFYQIVIEVAFSSVYKHCLELSYAWYQLTQSEASRYSNNCNESNVAIGKIQCQ